MQTLQKKQKNVVWKSRDKKKNNLSHLNYKCRKVILCAGRQVLLQQEAHFIHYNAIVI